MKGRLNIFQGAMLRWRELHPYNAVHVVGVDAPLDAPRMTRDIDAVLARRGLCGLVLDTQRRRYEYRGGPPQTALEVLTGGVDAAEVLRAAMERGINARFAPTGPIEPFRFFAVDAATSFHLGVAYDHVVAGGDSIVGLLAEIVLRYSGAAVGAPLPIPSLYPATSGRMLMRHAGYVLAGLAAIPGAMANARRSLRPRYPYGDDRRNAFAMMRIGKSGVAALYRAAKEWGVTRADLMIALLMRAIAPLAGEARHAKRRREIGIAWIVNIRREFGTSQSEAFGQFLSSYRCAHPVPQGISLRQLAQDVHRETVKVRRRKLYLVTLLALAGLQLLWPRLSLRRRGTVDAKNYASWAGLTPLDVDAVWRETAARAASRGPGRRQGAASDRESTKEADPSSVTIDHGSAGAEAPDEYLRAVSTGPASPLIVAATTVGGTLNLGFSYRIAAYTAEDIARIAASLTDDVNKIEA